MIAALVRKDEARRARTGSVGQGLVSIMASELVETRPLAGGNGRRPPTRPPAVRLSLHESARRLRGRPGRALLSTSALRLLVRAKLVASKPVDFAHLLAPVGRGGVDDVQDHRGFDDLFERGAEGLHQRRWAGCG